MAPPSAQIDVASTHDATAPDAEAEIRTTLDRGDHERALTLLARLHGAAIYRYVRGMMGSDDAADDVYQAIMLGAYRDLQRFDARATLRTWLFAIARHRCLDALKARRRRMRRFFAADQTPEPADPRPDAERTLTDAQVLSALAGCLQELSPGVRTAVLLRYQEGLGYDEMAAICGDKPATLRQRVSRAMPVLRACIERKEAR